MHLSKFVVVFITLFLLVESAFCASKYLPNLSNPTFTKTISVPISSFNGKFSVDIFWASNNDIIIQTPIENVYQDSLYKTVYPAAWFKKFPYYKPVSDSIHIKHLSKYYHLDVSNSTSFEEITDGSKVSKNVLPYSFIPLDLPVDTLLALKNYASNHKALKTMGETGMGLLWIALEPKDELINQRFAMHYKNDVTKDSFFIVLNQKARFYDETDFDSKVSSNSLGKDLKYRLINFAWCNTTESSIDVYNSEIEFISKRNPLFSSQNFLLYGAYYFPREEGTDDGSFRKYPRISISPDRKFILVGHILLSLNDPKGKKLGDLIKRDKPNMAIAVSPDWTKIAYIYYEKSKKSSFTAKIVITPLVLDKP